MSLDMASEMFWATVSPLAIGTLEKAGTYSMNAESCICNVLRMLGMLVFVLLMWEANFMLSPINIAVMLDYRCSGIISH
jgi:hypothetical protein